MLSRLTARLATITGVAAIGLSLLPAGAAHAIPTPPANDDITNATALTTSPVTGSNAGATSDSPGDVPKYNFNYGGASVWYKLSSPGAGRLSVQGTSSADGTNFDAQLAIYVPSGPVSDTGNVDEVGSGQRFGSFQNTAATAVLTQAGLDYYVVVDGYDSGSGAPTGSFKFNWSFTPAPANDNFANAATLSTTVGTPNTNASGNNTAASLETNEPTIYGYEYDGATSFSNDGAHSVWYKWTAPAAGLVTVDTHTSSFDTVMAVYTGTSFGTLNQVDNGASDDTSASDTTSEVKFTAASGVTYRIQIDGRDDGAGDAASGAFTVNLGEIVAPGNDNFANATVITGTSGTSNGTNVGATLQTNEPEPYAYYYCNYSGTTPANPPSGETVWYKWTAPSGGNYSFDTLTNGTFNTSIAVYTGSAVTNLTEQTCNDDYSPSVIQSRLVLSATGGQIYYIQVDGANDGTNPTHGTFTLTWRQPPVNDMFANAATITGQSGSTTGNNTGASVEYGEPQNASVLGGASVWWNWQAPANGSYYFKTKNSTFNTTLGIYTGSAVGSLTSQGSNDDVNGADNTSYATFTATAGTMYHVSVDGFQGTAGAIALAWGLVPPVNDDFANATLVTGASGNVTSTNVGATAETGEPGFLTGGKTVWFTWIAPGNDTYEFDTVGSSFDTLLGVYTGGAVGSLSPVAENDDISGANTKSKVIFTGASGTTYYIAVDGKGGATGAITMTWSVPPPDNTPPTITAFTPAAGAYVRGTSIPVTGDATDTQSTIQSMTFTIDDGSVITPVTDTTAPYGMTFDSTQLGDGSHTINVTATDSSNNTSAVQTHTFTVDNTAPGKPKFTVTLSPFTKASSVTLKFSGTDATSGVASYLLQFRQAKYTATGYGSWTTPSGASALTAGSFKKTGLAAGYTYCFQVISKDHAGNISVASAQVCTSRFIDDRSATRSSGWVKKTGSTSTYYSGTYLTTSKKGQTLTLSGFRGDRIGLLAKVCSTCGSVKVYVGTSLVKTFSLYSAQSKMTTLWVKFTSKTGTLKLVTASTKPVTIDAIGASKA